MGASNSRLEEDKGLQLCRARKKFIKQVLNVRCSLAAAHIAYTEELRVIGIALSQFVEPISVGEAFGSPSVSPEPRALLCQSPLEHVNVNENVSYSSSTPPPSRQYTSSAMQFRGAASRKVEEKLSTPVVVSIESPVASETLPWDYFGVFNAMDIHFSSVGFDQGWDVCGEISRVKEEEGMPELEDVHEKLSSHEMEESEDEFDEEPSSASLVRSFEYVKPVVENVVDGRSELTPRPLETNKPSNADEAKYDIVHGESSSIKSSENVTLETKSAADEVKNKSEHNREIRLTAMQETDGGDEVPRPKAFFSSINDIELLFAKASESGKEVPRMLEANKFHFRPVLQQRGSTTSSLLKSCFSHGKDLSEVQQDIIKPHRDSETDLTWHRTRSSRSTSSQNPFLTGSKDDDSSNDSLFDNSCMVSGSHVSTIDRLYAWEKKLYDEVKAGQVLKSHFDHKCKILRQKESRGANADTTRAATRDLYSRIRVAIHRIDSISKKIEEIRDSELQPQLEELIEGLHRMWGMMAESHKLQLHIILISHVPQSTKIKTPSDSRRQVVLDLQNELNSLSSSFVKWLAMQKTYVESINKWLLKCFLLPQNRAKRNKRMEPPPLRNWGPPICMICDAWLKAIDQLPSEGVVDSIKVLSAEVAHFLPHQDNKSGSNADLSGASTVRGDASDDGWMPRVDHFRTSLASFLGQLNNFAESSGKMFEELQMAIQEAKSKYEQLKSQRWSQVFV